jgi:DNA replication protein DnaC
MNQPTQALEHASVRQYCKALRMPVIGANFVRLSEQAIKEQRSHIGYLEALLVMEAEERDRHAIQKRLRDAKLPRLKTLEEFDFNQARQIPAAKIRELADGGYIERAEPVVFMGECGTGKTHLATGLCVAACRQKRRARFTTAANLVNELVEARQQNTVKRVLVRWLRYDVIVLDEVGYVPLAEIGAEFLFQVIAERAERAALIVTTNLPFPNGRRCSRIRVYAKPCWIASLTGHISSRLEPSRIAFVEPWRCGRKKRLRRDLRPSFYIAGAEGGTQTPSLPRRSLPAELGSHCSVIRRFGGKRIRMT